MFERVSDRLNGSTVHRVSFQNQRNSEFAHFDVNVKNIRLAVCVKVSCKQLMSNIFSVDVGFKKALRALQAGELVGLPTETVYGLAADATNENAVAKIYTAKGRPSFNPLIAHVSGLEMARRYGEFNKL